MPRLPLDPVLRKLTGGDRRSIRGVPELVRKVLADPSLFPTVFGGILRDEPLIRMRCADAVEKITAARPEYLRAYRQQLIELAETEEQAEVRWHLAQLLPRLRLNARERGRILEILDRYCTDESSIVKTFSMQAMAEIAAGDPRLRPVTLARLRELTRTGTPAMKARGRKLLSDLDDRAAPVRKSRRDG